MLNSSLDHALALASTSAAISSSLSSERSTGSVSTRSGSLRSVIRLIRGEGFVYSSGQNTGISKS